ncbi:hypothetical protein LOTGIDRAFT_163012 [Lottia gigantea]|uniref:C1q domain-containing protein n=1 Tax=Lottia gigantea TaxID=225164 RepID=V4AF83_LOTGI|nr:hypothetical protein LOTGIDRAFT_163012 [Lottia gigantea]ESO92006.1 hypothetical protein LOTGIDRAFT_163012 [Lottia gigantea]
MNRHKFGVSLHFTPTQSPRYTSYGNVKVGPNVHFFARMSGTKTLNMNSIVVFDEEIDDYDNNYNRGDGIFVAPVTGFYQFSWTLFTASKKNIYTELRVDNFVIDVAYDYSSAGSTSVSKTVICKVKKGNHVWIQTGGQYSENYFYKYVGSKNSFMGLLLHEANS